MYVTIDSPLARGASRVFYRDHGEGPVVVHLHGGWGYEVYSVAAQIAVVPARFVIPDRTGYGRSTPISELPPRFHEAAAVETERFLDALGIDRCIVWGHSDGAVIAALLGLRDPRRYRGIVLEALHRDREKPRSRQFFTDMAEDPSRFGERIVEILRADHGARWREVLQMDGRAWLAIAQAPEVDLFDGRLGELAPPTLILHGADDPRTEPGELAQIRAELPRGRVAVLDHGGHCPHWQRQTAAEVARLLADFVAATA